MIPHLPGAKPLTRVIRMVTPHAQVLAWNGLQRMCTRGVAPPVWYECQLAPNAPLAEKLPPYLESQQLSESARNSITDLAMNRSPAADDLVAIGERLEPRELLDREEPVAPVKRTRRRTRFGLNGPRGLALREFEKE